ncbi:hypothetical protein HPB48_013121 [Haemaphysalis longicornis]|uniref:Uncharacterized protein n=1 Tax=Haemaphysalis longicornis TaxID=44386 RepID=A0A9J6GXD3_HAELO|nr:hypothetical protein HPB48_013121 [Haemaphysalis longicornis]
MKIIPKCPNIARPPHIETESFRTAVVHTLPKRSTILKMTTPKTPAHREKRNAPVAPASHHITSILFFACVSISCRHMDDVFPGGGMSPKKLRGKGIRLDKMKLDSVPMSLCPSFWNPQWTYCSASKTSRGRKVWKEVICASRTPTLPSEEIKIFIRPQGGPDIANKGTASVASSIMAAAKIEKTERVDNMACPNFPQNSMDISITSIAAAEKYARIQEIAIQGITYAISAYSTAA